MGWSDWAALWSQFIDRSCGLPNYEQYLQHRREHHPGEPVLDQAAFFREVEAARYAGGKGKARCC